MRLASGSGGMTEVLIGWIGALEGADRLVIAGWVSHGTVGSYGGRLPPGGSFGWAALMPLSDWPNRPGDSE